MLRTCPTHETWGMGLPDAPSRRAWSLWSPCSISSPAPFLLFTWHRLLSCLLAQWRRSPPVPGAPSCQHCGRRGQLAPRRAAVSSRLDGTLVGPAWRGLGVDHSFWGQRRTWGFSRVLGVLGFIIFLYWYFRAHPFVFYITFHLREERYGF